MTLARTLREKIGMSAERAAEMAGVTTRDLREIEDGGDAAISDLRKIGRLYGVPWQMFTFDMEGIR
jgi:transcriptional regulator with XRE-family HTH domain